MPTLEAAVQAYIHAKEIEVKILNDRWQNRARNGDIIGALLVFAKWHTEQRSLTQLKEATRGLFTQNTY